MMKGSDILKDNKKERFAQDIASGVAPREAYLRLRPDTKKQSARVLASRWLQTPDVADRISFLKQQNAENAQWSRNESIEILKAIASNSQERAISRARAIEALNNMCGYNEPPAKGVTISVPFSFLSPDKGQ